MGVQLTGNAGGVACARDAVLAGYYRESKL